MSPFEAIPAALNRLAGHQNKIQFPFGSRTRLAEITLQRFLTFLFLLTFFIHLNSGVDRTGNYF